MGSIEKLSVIDLADLVKVLEDRFGVTAAAAAPAMAAAAAAPAAEEKQASMWSLLRRAPIRSRSSK